MKKDKISFVSIKDYVYIKKKKIKKYIKKQSRTLTKMLFFLLVKIVLPIIFWLEII